MLDLLSVVPYYTAHLGAALQERDDVRVDVAAIEYYLDPNCHRRLGVELPGWLLNAARRCTTPLLRRVVKTVESVVNLWLLERRLRRQKPDIVHVQFLPLFALGLPFELWLLRRARALGARIVYTVHNVLPHDDGLGRRARYGRLYQSVDQLICHDEVSRERLHAEFGIDAARIAVIPHGPLLADRRGVGSAEARTRLGIEPDACLVVWQGILRPYKGVDVLLEAWTRVAAAAPKARLIVAGTGEAPIVAEYRRTIEQSGIGATVRFEPRFLSIEELEDLHASADILVYPYRAITTSGALLTGIGYGKALVASRLDAFSSLLSDGGNALLAAPGDAGDLGRCLVSLIADPALRARLGAAARDVISWREIAAETARLYERVAGGNVA